MLAGSNAGAKGDYTYRKVLALPSGCQFPRLSPPLRIQMLPGEFRIDLFLFQRPTRAIVETPWFQWSGLTLRFETPDSFLDEIHEPLKTVCDDVVDRRHAPRCDRVDVLFLGCGNCGIATLLKGIRLSRLLTCLLWSSKAIPEGRWWR